MFRDQRNILESVPWAVVCMLSTSITSMLSVCSPLVVSFSWKKTSVTAPHQKKRANRNDARQVPGCSTSITWITDPCRPTKIIHQWSERRGDYSVEGEHSCRCPPSYVSSLVSVRRAAKQTIDDTCEGNDRLAPKKKEEHGQQTNCERDWRCTKKKSLGGGETPRFA